MTAQPIEFIGLVNTRESSETDFGSGDVIQPDYLRTLARAHETSGFDRVLIAHWSSAPDGFLVADQVLSATERLGVLLAHRPGFLAPTVAARAFATLDAFHPGRVALHTITGGDDADQARDGDFSDKVSRYRRSDEFLQIVRQEWTQDKPFDFEGEFYRVKGGLSSVRTDRIPVFFGGASEDAIRVGARNADVFAFWGEPLDGIRERIAQVDAAAAPHGRSLRYSVSTRPIVADTEEEAWKKAHEILEQTEANVAQFRSQVPIRSGGQEGSRRLLDYAAKGDLHDTRLWTALAKATGAAGNSTALVGSHEQVADALLEYVKLGVSTLLIRGYAPLDDARVYGDVVRLVRERAQDLSLVGAGA